MTVQWPFPYGELDVAKVTPLSVCDDNLNELENIVSIWVKQRKADESGDSIFFNEK